MCVVAIIIATKSNDRMKEYLQTINILWVSYNLTYYFFHTRTPNRHIYTKKHKPKHKTKYHTTWRMVPAFPRNQPYYNSSYLRRFRMRSKRFKRIRKRRRYITPYHKKRLIKIGCLTSPKSRILISRQGRTNNNSKKPLHVDTDSYEIGIDNHSTRCISPKANDFISPILPTSSILNGFSGSIKVKGVGTVQWKIQDDEGKEHIFKIKNCLYVPQVKIRLLSPQQWSQQRKQNRSNSTSSCTTLADSCVLQWDGHTKTIPLDPVTNVAIMRISSGYDKYRNFCSTCDRYSMKSHSEEVVAATSEMIEQEPVIADESLNHMKKEMPKHEYEIQELDDEIIGKDDLSEFMRWHYRLGHLPYAKMKTLCLLNILPRKFLKIKPPKCAGCIYSSMTRKPWTTNRKQNIKHIKFTKEPGMCVSVDQMESTTPGFIGQTKGILTKMR